MFLRKLPVLLLVAMVPVRAQEPLNPPAPLVAPAPAGMSPGARVNALAAARSAQELGLDAVAAELYRKLLATAPAQDEELTLALATVLLDDGRAVEAEEALQAYTGARSAGWHLRAALAAGQQKKVDVTRGELDAIKPDALPKSDTAWFFFLHGVLTLLTDTSGNPGRANTFFQQALDAATTELARARFQLNLEQARLRTGAVSDASIELQRQIMERNRGRSQGYEAARTLAVSLDLMGRKSRAIEVLQEQLRILPANDHARLDDFRLLLGLVGGAADGVGRYALLQLLEKGVDPRSQRIALQLLARASQAEPTRGQFRDELNRLIAATPPSKILEDLLLFRAQAALGLKTTEGYAQAEDDANTLREKFPGSPLLAHADTVLATAAWEQHRYRVAADNAIKARDALPPGAARAELGVLIAEARFLAGRSARAGGAEGAGDFRLAADAYAAALRDPPPGLASSDLMFQRVLAEIEAGELDGAQTLLDEIARDPAFDGEHRWQAEWNLARALQAAGKAGQAFARVGKLLAAGSGENPAALPPELRARMAWLQVRLSYDVEPSVQTLKLADDLGRSLEGVEALRREEILSTGALLKAQTLFVLKRDAEAFATLDKLGADFPKSSAAIYAYIVKADYLAQQDKAADAQKLLTELAEKFPQSEYAPYALFQAALQAERRGQEENYQEAVRRIEELVQKYPASNLIFAARFKQGDLLRQMNQFALAQDVYQSLVDNYSQHGDIILAQLALAQCHNAQSASDPSHAENAQESFRHLLARLDAPLDVRVEAGYNLGELLARRGDLKQTLEVWWRDMVHEFLLKDPSVGAQLGPTGRYWMARTLLRTGEILEQQQRLEEAKTAWLLVLQLKLPFETLAKQKLAQFNLAEPGR